MYNTIILKNSISNIKKEINSLEKKLAENGNLFCYVKNDYIGNEIKNDIFDLMEYCTSIDLSYVNTIIVPESTSIEYDNIQYIIWFVKDKEKMFFNKDAIREKHIWKDVEWGKREKNYNFKGKDPGNVWIPTLDDGKGKITEHILLQRKKVYDRILDATIQKNDNIFILSDEKEDRIYQYKQNNITFKYIENNSEHLKDLFIRKKDEYNSNNCNVSRGKVIFESSEEMNNIRDESVSLVVTSPPYWDLKDYFKENQIGKEDYKTYSNRIFNVWKECYRKLKFDGSMWVNINVRVRNNKPIYLPKLFIEQCKKIGFIFNGILIWHKSSGIPTNSKNIVDRHEYVLIFTKSKKNKLKSLNINNFSDYKNKEINGGFIWNINRKAGSIGKKTIHPAIFPTELINRIIKVSTSENDVVLDPFLGSGTSLIASLNNNRNFIGYEFNEGFKDLMNSRFKNEIIKYKEDKIEYV